MMDDGVWRKGGSFALYAPFMPVLLIALGSLAFALAKTSAMERDMRIAATQNMLWVVTQTQMEVMALALSTAAPNADADDIAQRYDLTLARLNLLLQGPQARYLEQIDHLDLIAAIHRDLLDSDPMVLGHSDDLHDTLHAMARTIHPKLNRVANDVMTADWNQSAEQLDDYRATQRRIIIAVGFALFAAFTMSWLLLRNQGRLHRAEFQRLHAASLLEQEKDISAMYRDFAAMVSHQMRTPLSLIDSAMHRLARKGEAITADDVADRTKTVRDAIHRLTRLLDAVLLMGRVDNDQLDGKLEPIDMERVTRTVISEIQTYHPDRMIRLSCSEHRIVARADPDLVSHILDNLLSNAVKFSPPDLPIEVRLFSQRDEIACAVTDQGPGIALKDRAHLFKRYYRGAGQTAGSGTGLGLALAQELAELQDGRISVDSWPGKGSVFTLWLPTSGDGSDHDPT